MKGFSIYKGRWLTLLVMGAFILLILPILAGAQAEPEEPAEESTPAAEESSEEVSEETEAVEGEAGEEGTEPESAVGASEILEAVSSPQAEPEEKIKYHYFILHSTEPDLPLHEWDILDRFPTDTNYTWEQPKYFGFFKKDPNPEKPMDPDEPKEPEKPDEADYEDLPDAMYKEAMSRYDEALVQYEKDLEGYAKYMETYPELLKEYEQELEEYESNIYPQLEHYYFYEKNVPNRNRKKAIYKFTITQAEKSEQETEPVDLGMVPAPLTTDEPISTDEPNPAPPKDLELPAEFWYEDRPNDGGGAIALRWSTTKSDTAKVSYIPPPPPAEEEKEEAEEKKPEYDLNRFIVDAWVYIADLEVPGDLDKWTVTTDLSRLGGDEKSELEFVGIVDTLEKGQKTYDYGLGLHFRGEFKIDDPRIGSHIIWAKATAEGEKARRGRVKVKKIFGAPVSASKPEDIVTDTYYEHYFKLGVDTWDHKGYPRWIVEQESDKGVVGRANIWNWAKFNTFIIALLYTATILTFISYARKGKKLFVRRIAGLDHVEEAIGRATEMGKPILFVPGIGSMADVATIAAMNILGQVARKVAEYDSRILVPNKDPIVMTVAQEVTQEAYIDAGHPDKYNKDDVFFLTEDQFSFAAAVDGIMVRDRPATILFMGMFFAESLILAETGAGTGAIQIAGTDAIHQLPFFITACDYTLIGEELYAASAYLSREPLLLGSLKGQDLGKAVIFIAIFLGVILATFGIEFIATLFISLS